MFYGITEGITLSGRQLLGVVQQAVLVTGRQDDGCCINASGKASPPGFVAAGLNKILIIMIFQHKG